MVTGVASNRSLTREEETGNPDNPYNPEHHVPSGYDRLRKKRRNDRIINMKIEEGEEGLCSYLKREQEAWREWGCWEGVTAFVVL
jgi:hypothetical protein